MLAAASAIACSDQQKSAPTAPDVGLRLAASTGNACTARLGKTIGDEQVALYSGATLTQAQNLWTPVVRDCKQNLAAAQEEMMLYVQFTIDKAAINGGLSTATGSGTVSHWNSVFDYVGYPQPNVNPSVFSLQGGAEVVSNPVDSQEVRTLGSYAAITLYHQTGAWPTRLITIYPRGSATCITGTNLIQRSNCFEFSANPRIYSWSTNGPLLGVCHVEHDVLTSLGSANNALGHQPSPSGQAEILNPISTYPTFCGDPDPVLGLHKDWWNDGLKTIATRLAQSTIRALSPENAYASHSGIGGGALICDPDLGCLSPVAVVDRRVFFATFTSDTVDRSPGTPERGSWFQTIRPPGSILIQSSLGTINSNLAVLSQAGGNCDKKCSGLELWALAASANSQTASTGIYDISWDFVEDAPAIKFAPVVIRSTSGSEIARLTLSTKSSSNDITFTYRDGTGVVSPIVGNWIQHEAKHVHIIVDFTVSPATVELVTPGAGFKGQFVDAAATNIGSIRADFGGIDSGIFGWENVLAERRSDH
jgi:hypothetical protein